MINLTTIFIGNFLAVLLLITLFLSDKYKLDDDKDSRFVLRMMVMTFAACIIDPFVFFCDGKAGLINTLVVYIGNTYLYLADAALGLLWTCFVIAHLNIPFTNKRKRVYTIIMVVAVAGLIINLFYPFIFEVKNNVYKRGNGYWLYLAICFIEILDGLYLYIRCRNKAGVMKFFPVHIFILPVAAGTTIQSLVYGVSVIWPSIAIASAGVMTAIKNEAIFVDQLTGIYNREYLKYLQQFFYRKNDYIISCIMIDLNGFKQINDKFGHTTGDKALVDSAKILKDAFGEYGSVARYGGDEFVVILNVDNKELVDKLINNCNKLFEEFNNTSTSLYKLSVAMGYITFNVKDYTINEFMNIVDQKMYENKVAYYKKPEFDRRNR